MTERDKLIAGLKACGYVRDEMARTKRYEVYTRPGHFIYLVGKAGGLRRTRGSVASSMSFTDTPLHIALKKVGASASEYATPAEAIAALQEFVKPKPKPVEKDPSLDHLMPDGEEVNRLNRK